MSGMTWMRTMTDPTVLLPCEPCGGLALAEDGIPCRYCEGTGTVAMPEVERLRHEATRTYDKVPGDLCGAGGCRCGGCV